MPIDGARWSVRDRVLAVLAGRTPDRHPFISRLEIWYSDHSRAGTLPKEFQGKSLAEVHRAVGIGQQRFVVPYGLRLRGVDVRTIFNGEVVFQEHQPIIAEFPGMWDCVPVNRAGVTITELRTPLGRLTVSQAQHEDGIARGTAPYLKDHLVKEPGDFKIVESILEQAEFVPLFERLREEEAHIADAGYVVPLLHRIPFQQVLLEYLGETALFYALHDDPNSVTRLVQLLDLQMDEILRQIAGLDVRYVEFPDNLHGWMTNPRLFTDFCLPAYQHYTQILHSQGKKAGSHTDGDVRPLLGLLAESGLDVCESVSPIPLTTLPFEEAWEAWSNGPIIWGGIPSPVLERGTPEREFESYLDRFLECIGNGPIIIGVGDMVMGNNLIDRVRTIAERVEARPLR